MKPDTPAFDDQSLAILADAVRSMSQAFGHLPPLTQALDTTAIAAVLQEAASRMSDNAPYHHPLYIGQMLKPPHPVARLAYALAMFLNPNNHALDGGRASSAMEKAAVAALAGMFGWQDHLGHLTGGGTMANFEALWVARELRPGQTIVASAQSHYTHSRLSAVLGVPFRQIAVDTRGRIDINDLERNLKNGDIGTVVVTLGTTAVGSVDPLAEILELRKRHDFRIHVDSAYGGYFRLARNLDPEARRHYDAMTQADSIVIDPHKHGLQPYGCGCVLFHDPSVGRFYKHDSPYTYFSSAELHLGEISLECSRAGASAVALWSTMQLLPLEIGGQFGQDLESCRQAALLLYKGFHEDNTFAQLFPPELDIVVWAVRADSATESSTRARLIYEAAERNDLHLALATLPRAMLEPYNPVQEWDADRITCLRACAMKPEHRDWMPEILTRLHSAAR